MKSIPALSAALFIILAALCVDANAVSYQVTDAMLFAPGSAYRISGINNSGTIVGTVNSKQAFVWNSTTGFSYLAERPGFTTSVTGINDSGQVVGYIDDGRGNARAYLWEPGGSVRMLFDDSMKPSYAFGINNRGEVVGSYSSIEGSRYSSHWFLWSAEDGLQDIADVTGHPIYVGAINDSGMLAGANNAGPVVWSPEDGLVQIPAMGFVRRINNAGMCLWVNVSPDGPGPDFIWQKETGVEYVEALCGPRFRANDINDFGQMVGNAYYSPNTQPSVWDRANGTQLLPLPVGHIRGFANAINNTGLIAGYSYDASGAGHMVLWTPVPEQSSLIAILAGLAGMGGFALNRGRR